MACALSPIKDFYRPLLSYCPSLRKACGISLENWDVEQQSEPCDTTKAEGNPTGVLNPTAHTVSGPTGVLNPTTHVVSGPTGVLNLTAHLVSGPTGVLNPTAHTVSRPTACTEVFHVIIVFVMTLYFTVHLPLFLLRLPAHISPRQR